MRLFSLAAITLAALGCDQATDLPAASGPATPGPAVGVEPNPRDGLLRDFLEDGKFDEAGRPLSAHVTEPASVCTGEVGPDGGLILGAAGCDGPLAGSTQAGELTLDVKLRAAGPSGTSWGTIAVADAAGATLAETVVTAAGLRSSEAWTHLALRWPGGSAARVVIRPAAGATLVVGALEVFPARFRLALGPGSQVVDPEADRVTVEWPLDAPSPRFELAGADVTSAVAALLEAGEATLEETSYRQVLNVPVSGLFAAVESLPEGPAPLVVRAAGETARMQLRRAEDPCRYEGPADAPVKVLVTGFEPFPADAWHENISGVGVAAMEPSRLRGARLMRLVVPVEYDLTPARIVDAIRRCEPDVVIDFGQGGSDIALEQTAYNLKDTGEVPGGAPDNRGVISTARPIEAAGPAERHTSLPLEAVEAALATLGVSVVRSDDPGRYVCNNVFYRVMEAVEGTGVSAGFVHLPYTTWFGEEGRARWGRTLEAIVQAVVDARG